MWDPPKPTIPGDLVLADRGFDISDMVGILQAWLHIPAFIRGKTQLSAMDTCTIANVWIHVELGNRCGSTKI